MGHRTTKTNHKVKVHKTVSCRLDFFYYAFRNVLLVSIPLLIVSSVVLSHLSFHSSAASSGSGVDQIQFSLSVSCTLSSAVDSAHTKEITNGTYHSDVGKTTITTLCNDGNGYSVYAVGYSNNEEGNTKLINAEHPEYSIDTGLATSGLISNWAMKLNNIPDDPSPTPPTIESDYNDVYGIVPPYWTKVAGRASGTTDMAQGSSFATTYAVYASSSQYAGTYRGQVKYILVHPSSPFKDLTMQSIATWKDIVLPNEGDSVQAVDERDGKKYWVTRLADGNVWMTQNLDFDIDTNTTLNSNTTDLNVAYNSSTEQYAEYNDDYTKDNGIIYYTPASTATTIDFTGTTVTGWQNSNTAPYTANKTDSTETGHSSLGNYYNWTAAIASNNSSSLTQNTLSDISKNPKNSICPKGWRLPTISSESETLPGSTNEYSRLNYLYNDNQTSDDAGLINQPLFFVKGGLTQGGGLSVFGVYAYYWSSTINTDYVYYFRLADYAPVVDTTRAGGFKYNGFNIRCVAK